MTINLKQLGEFVFDGVASLAAFFVLFSLFGDSSQPATSQFVAATISTGGALASFKLLSQHKLFKP